MGDKLSLPPKIHPVPHYFLTLPGKVAAWGNPSGAEQGGDRLSYDLSPWAGPGLKRSLLSLEIQAPGRALWRKFT
ncbi:hypothetical protein P7K49_009029, partial [Saguinus oedipus]